MKRLMLPMMILIALLVSGCSFFDVLNHFGFTSARNNTRVTTDTFDGVIFGAQHAGAAGLEYEFNVAIFGYWTPTAEQVTALESRLTDFLESEIAPDDYRYGFWEELATYKRQYFGILFEAERPLIYANTFCDSAPLDYWLEGYVVVMDGGDCFFQVLYDPASDSFSNLRINGVA